MHTTKRRNLLIGGVAGASATALAAILMGQGTNQPSAQPSTPPSTQPSRIPPGAMSDDQHFVTEQPTAYLWVREGSTLRSIGQFKAVPGSTDKDWDKDKERDKTKDPYAPKNPPK